MDTNLPRVVKQYDFEEGEVKGVTIHNGVLLVLIAKKTTEESVFTFSPNATYTTQIISICSTDYMPASPPDVKIEHPKQHHPLQEAPSVTMQDLWNAIQSFQDQVLVRLDRMESRLDQCGGDKKYNGINGSIISEKTKIFANYVVSMKNCMTSQHALFQCG